MFARKVNWQFQVLMKHSNKHSQLLKVSLKKYFDGRSSPSCLYSSIYIICLQYHTLNVVLPHWNFIGVQPESYVSERHVQKVHESNENSRFCRKMPSFSQNLRSSKQEASSGNGRVKSYGKFGKSLSWFVGEMTHEFQAVLGCWQNYTKMNLNIDRNFNFLFHNVNRIIQGTYTY